MYSAQVAMNNAFERSLHKMTGKFDGQMARWRKGTSSPRFLTPTAIVTGEFSYKETVNKDYFAYIVFWNVTGLTHALRRVFQQDKLTFETG